MHPVAKTLFAVPLLAVTGLRTIGARRRPLFRILIFHDVPPDAQSHFRSLVGWLVRTGRLISPAEAGRRLAGESTAEFDSGVLLSFDDGFASNFEVAESVLEPHGAKALFFVCPGLINTAREQQQASIRSHIFRNMAATRSIPTDLRLMTWQELEKLSSLGHSIASHTLSHMRLAGAPKSAVEDQIGGAAEELHRRFGNIPEWFAYPFGDIESIDSASLQVVARFHRFCRSGVRGINDGQTNPLAILADHVDLNAPLIWQRVAARGGLDLRYQAARDRLDRYANLARSFTLSDAARK